MSTSSNSPVLQGLEDSIHASSSNAVNAPQNVRPSTPPQQVRWQEAQTPTQGTVRGGSVPIARPAVDPFHIGPHPSLPTQPSQLTAPAETQVAHWRYYNTQESNQITSADNYQSSTDPRFRTRIPSLGYLTEQSLSFSTSTSQRDSAQDEEPSPTTHLSGLIGALLDESGRRSPASPSESVLGMRPRQPSDEGSDDGAPSRKSSRAGSPSELIRQNREKNAAEITRTTTPTPPALTQASQMSSYSQPRFVQGTQNVPIPWIVVPLCYSYRTLPLSLLCIVSFLPIM
ncbi:hypothetical protein BDN72DRAFT_907545 [Pluteus cervinus]|uniref:Uncharacterized protein n=1 Tax=Pluteus cervinus TaxID=181527 RepID=A0ACD2ZWU1_9AGAR|nr:hypothetical protein BDN72DRAFT_907545 [Pluteus cervinus]